VSGLAPRALEGIVRPRRLSGVVVRPLNFTVRPPARTQWLRLTLYGAAVYWCGVQLHRDAPFYQARARLPER
jgi:hypothetical protein